LRVCAGPWELGVGALGVDDRHSGCGCHSVVKLLADYLERQLPPALRADLESHLQQCPRCVKQLRTYESTVSMLRSLRDDELPAELRLTVTSFIDAKCHNN
jgi:anti-sigma factor RsiW